MGPLCHIALKNFLMKAEKLTLHYSFSRHVLTFTGEINVQIIFEFIFYSRGFDNILLCHNESR